jgi:hypothetical protein
MVALGPVTPWTKIGAVFLDVMGVLIIVGGLFAIVGGAAIRDIGDIGDTAGFGDAVGGALAILGVILVVIGVLQLLSGLFAWRGSSGGRVGGIIFGVLFGLFGLLGLIGSGRSSDTTGSIVISLILAVGYLYTAACSRSPSAKSAEASSARRFGQPARRVRACSGRPASSSERAPAGRSGRATGIRSTGRSRGRGPPAAAAPRRERAAG